MRMIGAIVVHNVLGEGVITEHTDKYVKIRFYKSGSQINFVYPDAFEKSLKFDSVEYQNRALAECAKKKQRQQEDKIKKIEELRKRAYEQPIAVQSTKAEK